MKGPRANSSQGPVLSVRLCLSAPRKHSFPVFVPSDCLPGTPLSPGHVGDLPFYNQTTPGQRLPNPPVSKIGSFLFKKHFQEPLFAQSRIGRTLLGQSPGSR